MASPQPGIFALGTAAHAYLEFDVVASWVPPPTVKFWLFEVPPPGPGVNTVIG